MIMSFAVLRIVAWLKRLSLAAERSAEAQETLARISQDEWNTRHAPRPRGKLSIGTLDQAAANEHWRAMHKDEYDIDTE
jgi:hypothetical protein